jgi:hypothetical protein
VHFAGASQNARGVVVGYRWDFGDGTDPSADPNPVHTYTVSGPHAAVLTVTDDDGAVATRSVNVIVGQPSTDVAPAPSGLALSQNVPNPFGPVTTIRFTLPRPARVMLGVYDLRGAHMRDLVRGLQPEGQRVVSWDGRDADGRPVGAGIYFLRLEAEGRRITRRMVVIR